MSLEDWRAMIFSWLGEYWPGLLVFFGAMISAVGGILIFYQQSRFERELRTKSDKIAELSQKIEGSVTGGDSYPYVSLFVSNSKPERWYLMLHHKGDHPLYDIEVQVIEEKQFQKLEQLGGELTLEDVEGSITNIKAGNLAPGSIRKLADWKLPEGDRHSYTFNIFARNGFVTEIYRLHRVKGDWESAKKVIRPGPKGERILLEEVRENFPRDEKGQVQW